MQQTVTCPNCGSQSSGKQFCTNCGTALGGGGQEQVWEAPAEPGAPSVVGKAGTPRKYIFLGATAIIFKIFGWLVLGGGILGSVGVAVLAAQGVMPGLVDLLDRGMAILGAGELAGAGLAVMVFAGIIGSLVCGLGFLAFAELCSAVIAIDDNTREGE